MKFPVGTAHNPSLLKQSISNGMKHPARTSPSVVRFAPERWSLCVYYFPLLPSAPFRCPIKPNISRPPKRDTNSSASNRFILVLERMNHHNNKLWSSNGVFFRPFWIWFRAVPDWEAGNHSCTKLVYSPGLWRFFAVFDFFHWKETRRGAGCLPFKNVIRAVFSME